jgi:hypothetical protein
MHVALFNELAYRDCPWCKTVSLACGLRWSQVIRAANGVNRLWAVFVCPRCAGAILIEVEVAQGVVPGEGSSIPGDVVVRQVREVPDGGHREFEILHLPEDVSNFLRDAVLVLRAGVPDAAAVQLRRTLEAAAAHREVKEKTLVQSIEKLINAGAVTRDFGDVLHYVRKLGNLGAHYTDEKLSQADVERALRFTAQLLRNLFEVPGELDQLRASES